MSAGRDSVQHGEPLVPKAELDAALAILREQARTIARLEALLNQAGRSADDVAASVARELKHAWPHRLTGVADAAIAERVLHAPAMIEFARYRAKLIILAERYKHCRHACIDCSCTAEARAVLGAMTT